MGQQLSALAQNKIIKLHEMTALAYSSIVGQQYAATPTVAQTLNDKIVEDGNWFLQAINVVPVDEIVGEKVFLGLSGSVASRTDTSGSGERSPKNLADINPIDYQLYKTDFDVGLRYSTIDAWAKFKDFAERYNRAVRKAIGNDRVKIGWNGTSVAATTSEADLSDVNIGWLHQIRNFNSGSQYVLGDSGSITLGSADFPNLDVLVLDAKGRLDPVFKGDPDLVVLIGDNVLQAAKGSLYEAQGNTPSEKEKAHNRMVIDTYAGLPAYVPPFFDPDSILVTSFENLSIYFQDTSVRREQMNNPKKDRYEDYLSDNEGYIVEELGKTSLIEGIEYV